MRCLIIHTTKPVKTKKARLASQRLVISGYMKIHMVDTVSFCNLHCHDRRPP
jgi:hypothetical protein